MIAIVDYQAGNLVSVKKALQHLGAPCAITGDPRVVAGADKIVLPGVGHFAATSELERSGLSEAIRESVGSSTPFLGICVGMQWMFESSEEAPEVSGAGFLLGRCVRFSADVKSPHVGWNRIQHQNRSRLLRDVPPGSFVYYTHSYRAPVVNETVAQTEYGGAFSAVVECANVFGVQFHPEKSAETGLKILGNFCSL